ncbi:MAG: hypothetical protein WAU44_19450 [Nitrospira sp.]|jgi:hypothetical protein|uniref:hypothetical protein n=1 Tax=Nitrospira sp. ND1 TaxID=1658518 RepID=UPI0009BC23F2|nr:hypothetical protein [Nitrospira sp. ND1]MBK7417896.1 hypothetical protein [Nitrospira sp.]OYT22927.1 MAG: hypothetical protein CCU27_11900 [Nitrospira sp. UW-LDO-02]MBK7485106.1 hypothetical protein [Nitrospira sp.]MBK8377101.1 hypothetical protein [Nitrospira sp.]MBK9112424.1 hypothetical protein [Nitrospira sp.]
MDRSEISAIVEKAIDRFVEEQSALLDLDVTERALSHYLAIYLAALVPGTYDVDVEYNRHFGDPKRLWLPTRKALDRELRATTVFPDIIVHQRITDKNNLLVLEMKKPGEDLAYDNLKLQAFRKELGYIHTAHVILGRGNLGQVVREVKWLDG